MPDFTVIINNLEIYKLFEKEISLSRQIIPGISTLESIIAYYKQDVEDGIFNSIINTISNPKKLYELFDDHETGVSFFSHLKNLTVNPTQKGAKEIINAIEYIRSFEVDYDIGNLQEKKLSYYKNEIFKSDRYRIQRFKSETKKIAYLSLFLIFKESQFIDMLLDILKAFVNRQKLLARNKVKADASKTNQIKDMAVVKLRDFATAINNFKNYEEVVEFREQANSVLKQLEEYDFDRNYVEFMIESHNNFQFILSFLEKLDFKSTVNPNLVKILEDFKNQKRKKIIDIDINEFDDVWKKAIVKNKYSKSVLNVAMAVMINDNVRSGILFHDKSTKYRSYDSYLVQRYTKKTEQEAIEFLLELKKSFKKPEKVVFSEDIVSDETEKSITERVYSYIPRVSMTDILYEVNEWTGFLECFHDPEHEKFDERKSNLVAAILASGYNMGPSKMSLASGIDESTLRRTKEYYLTHTTLSEAQKILVNYQYNQSISKMWGEGNRSSSDGMRIANNSKTIYADYNGHYKNKGTLLYRHINDQYSPYYVQILEGRDSDHVLDGLLHHGTELDISEHSTDTTGYSEQMFALTYLLDFSFRPRIKGSESAQLYYFEAMTIDNYHFKKVNEKIIIENFSEISRLITSIKEGKVKASLILQKINSYARKNHLAIALRELGRLIKTKYLLEYHSNATLRQEVQAILNKGEAINSVARLFLFGKSGRVNEATIEEQLVTATSLNILISSLVIWNTRYINKIYNEFKQESWITEKSFRKISPLGTQYVNMYGTYNFDYKKISDDDGLRLLNKNRKLVNNER